MFLTYGISEAGELISIEQASRGLSGLNCPYCGKPLIARKGEINAHHFAHAEDTCRAVESRAGDYFSVPLFETFNLNLKADDIAHLSYYSQNEETQQRFKPEYEYTREGWLWRENYIKEAYQRSRYSPAYELTHKGKIPLGELSMSLFEREQASLIREKLQSFADNVNKRADYDEDYSEPLTDYKIFRAQLRRLLESTLYFLEITHSEGKLYKIGITTRTVEERAKEIEYFVKREAGLQQVSIEILGSWEQRGYIEPYFIYRYEPNRAEVAQSREYFSFDESQLRRVLSYDLRRLPERELTDYELDILEGEPGSLERILEQERRAREEAEARAEAEQARIEAIKAGMREAQEAGKHVGRPIGASESDEQTLSKYPEVIELIQQGESLRSIARLAGCSINTVRKVKQILENQS